MSDEIRKRLTQQNISTMRNILLLKLVQGEIGHADYCAQSIRLLQAETENQQG